MSILPPLQPAASGAGQVLSFGQERLWLLHQMVPDSPVYNVPVVLRWAGALDRGALLRALDVLLTRHAVLRSGIELHGEIPRPVLQRVRAVLPMVDLTVLEAERRGDIAYGLCLEETRRPFDLAVAPLLRCVLVRLAEDDHVLVLTLHHIVFDGLSRVILLRELAVLYRDCERHAPSSLPVPTLAYADFAAWQRTWLQGDALAEQLCYWRTHLDGAPVVDLPADRPRPARPSTRGTRFELAVSAALAHRLREVSRRDGATLFVTLLAAYDVLLSRYSGSQDLVVGVPVGGRRLRETEDLVGFFVNTLALRVRLADERHFSDLVRQVQQVVLDALAHQDLPFDHLVEALRPERESTRNPLCPVVFSLQPVPAAPPFSPTAQVDLLDLPTGTAKFDCGLHLFESRDGVEGYLEYAADLFEAPTMARLGEDFCDLLAEIVESSALAAVPVGSLAVLGTVRRHQVLCEWNDSRSSYPATASLQELFERQVARVPERIVLGAGGVHWSYGELNRRANRLAHRLRELGVGPDVPVALCVERSPEMVVAVLAILKAGGCYVPLDPGYPEERLALMLDDAAARVLVTRRHLVPPGLWRGREMFDLDDHQEEIADLPAGDPCLLAGPANLAYIMYTSGSTGRPKGVGVPQQAVVRLVQGVAYAPLDDDEVLTQLATTSFDASTFEIWAALLNGLRLVLLAPGLPTVSEIARAIDHEGVTTTIIAAGLFHQMIEHHPEALARLRVVLAGADVLAPNLVQDLLARIGRGRVLNGYGPTETTTIATCHTLRNGDRVTGSVSIGRPIANTDVVVLDRRLRLVPQGVPGELAIGGDGLARGYWGRPDLTAARFIPHPAPQRPGLRLYRSGDLVRHRTDGSLEFLGRIDDQVKVRGIRVEPGEVEAALLQLPAVVAAAVVARAEAGGDKRLVAYVVLQPGVEAGAAELRTALRRRLPEHLVPSRLVFLDALPIAGSGKVDRQLLPAVSGERPRGAAAPRTPETPVEEALTEIWCALLGLDAVGRDDHFFALGGHSMAALRLVTRLRDRFEVDLTLAQVFEQPVLADLAAAVDRLLIEQVDRLSELEAERLLGEFA